MKISINKIGYIVLGVAVLVVAFAGLGMARTRQGGELAQLENDLSIAKLRLEKLQEQPLAIKKAELENRLLRAQEQLDAAKTSLRQDLDDIAITSSLFDLARQSRVRISEVRTTGVSSETFQGIPCITLPVNLTVTGELPDILQFIKGLGDTYATGMIKNVSFDFLKTGASASIRLVIYSYRGG